MILLGYLPYETHKWEQHIKNQKKIYDQWELELIIKPNLRPEPVKQVTDIGQEYGEVSDHPLNVKNTSLWSRYFCDQNIWVEIEKDIRRTRTDMGFFFDARDPSKRHLKDQLKRQAEFKKADLCGNDRIFYIETHADVLARILFIYAKLNPGVDYVQGMNEILATLYYCFYDP